VARPRVRSAPVRLWWPLAIVAALTAFLPVPASVIDDLYSRTFYPFLQFFLTAASNLVPIALLDVLIVVVAIMLLVRIVMLLRVAATDDVMDAAWEGFKRIVRAVSLAVIVFFAVWGFNYRRVPLAPSVPAVPTAAALQAAVADANSLAARLRPTVVKQPELGYEDVARELLDPMNAALSIVRRPSLGRAGRAKYSLILTPFFTMAGVSGMINPFALESVVDPGLLPSERPFVLAHEWAHLSGHADEAEANALGWLACMKGGPALAYSASLYLITEAAGDLPPAARRAALAKLADGVRTDLELIANRVEAGQRPEVQRAAFRAYDQYLKVNQVQDGTASYGRALTLILASPMREALNDYRAASPRR
jgi:hypothetical protein